MLGRTAEKPLAPHGTILWHSVGDRAVKAVLFPIAVGLFASACGPGVADIAYRITDDYFYSDTGATEKMIVYRGNAVPRGIVIDARVDEYRVDRHRIVVARRPRLVTAQRNQSTTTSLSNTCEHWVIDTLTHQVTQVTDASLDAKLPCNSPFDQQFNPRL